MNAQKWTRRSLRQLSGRLVAAGDPVSHQTVGRLLKGLDDALHVTAKKREAGAGPPDRGDPFDHIAQQRQAFAAAGWPIMSVDTTKKELIGNFTNAGRSWSRTAEAVPVHDFWSEAVGRAVPDGIDDLQHNRGTVVVGTSADTPAFAVAAIARWWDSAGAPTFPGAAELLILADAGGSNGCRPRRWKPQLQEQLCDQRGLTVTVCHDPTGCSTWNPIEQRLFGPISLKWAGTPLRTWDTILADLRGTTTTTSLTVQAFLHDTVDEAGRVVTDAAMRTLNRQHHALCPHWNDTVRPRESGSDGSLTPSFREVVA
jgi:DDE family transposase